MLQLIDMFQHRGSVSTSRKKNLCLGQVGGVTYCSDHDHLLRCGQTVAPRYHALKAFQCIRLYGNHSLQNSACGREGGQNHIYPRA